LIFWILILSRHWIFLPELFRLVSDEIGANPKSRADKAELSSPSSSFAAYFVVARHAARQRHNDYVGALVHR